VRALGINAAGAVLYVAVADDGIVVDLGPYTFELAAGLGGAQQLVAARSEMENTLRSLKVDRVRILDAETTFRATISAVRARITLETLLSLAAADADVDCTIMARATCRALLGLPRSGQLVDHVAQVTGPIGPKWSRKRDLAAVVAVAAVRQP
jgi:hypothetical protein